MTRDVVRMAMMAVLVGCGGAAATPSAAGAGTPVVSAPVPLRFEPCPDPAGGGRWSVIRLTEFLPRDRSRADVEQTLLGRARLAIVERDLGIAVSGVTSAGLSTTVQPAASAGARPQPAIGIGKFQGTMTPTTPTGSLKVMSIPPGTGI